MARLRLGTRGSPLALAQSRGVAASLERAHRGLSVEIAVIRTTGDRDRVTPLAGMGGKGVFVKEIEEALLAGTIDIAVHSLKDVPAQLPEGLTLAAFPERADPHDLLVTRDGAELDALPSGTRIGTGALRRRAQLLAHRPDLVFLPQRGNVETRLRHLAEGRVDALVLAAAGIERLGLRGRIAAWPLPEEICLPAACQGIVAVQARQDDVEWCEAVGAIGDASATVEAASERGFLSELAGSCLIPAAAFARFDGARVRVRARILSLDGARQAAAESEGTAPDAWHVGVDAARECLERGGRQILDELESQSPGVAGEGPAREGE